jgi:hypothetical protein
MAPFNWIAQEIADIKSERDADFHGKAKPLCFIPIVFMKYFTESGLTLLISRIPDDLAYELVPVVAMTGEAPSIFIPDVTVIVDSGMGEVEYSNPATRMSYVQEEVVPESIRLGGRD